MLNGSQIETQSDGTSRRIGEGFVDGKEDEQVLGFSREKWARFQAQEGPNMSLMDGTVWACILHWRQRQYE